MTGKTREFLQGYGAALADFSRLNLTQAAAVYRALQMAGLNYHDLMDAGVETFDLGEIARCREAFKKEERSAKVSRETSAAVETRS